MSVADFRRGLRASFLVGLAVLVASAAGCGAAGVNPYRTALAKQEQCCDGLADAAAREACRGGILRVESEAAETIDVNRETFECVDRHFRCEAATGRATGASAQAQLDCLNDLGAP